MIDIERIKEGVKKLIRDQPTACYDDMSLDILLVLLFRFLADEGMGFLQFTTKQEEKHIEFIPLKDLM